MPRRQKSVHSWFMDTLIFISVIGLVGHFSFNLWTRFSVHNDLSRMKCSLNSLKDTINHIGSAYHQLYKEVRTLADVAEIETLKVDVPHRYEPFKYGHKLHYNKIAQKNVNDIQLAAMTGIGAKNLPNTKTDIKAKVTQTVSNKNTQVHHKDVTTVCDLVTSPECVKKDQLVKDKLNYLNKNEQHLDAKAPRDNEYNIETQTTMQHQFFEDKICPSQNEQHTDHMAPGSNEHNIKNKGTTMKNPFVDIIYPTKNEQYSAKSLRTSKHHIKNTGTTMKNPFHEDKIYPNNKSDQHIHIKSLQTVEAIKMKPQRFTSAGIHSKRERENVDDSLHKKCTCDSDYICTTTDDNFYDNSRF